MANTSNYQQNSIDLDFIYIGANESEYFSLDPQSIKNRKTVMFGQNLINNSYRVVNVGDNFLPSNVNVPKNDYDNTQIIGVTPTAIYYNDTVKTQTYVRGAFNLLENTPQREDWLIRNQTDRYFPIQVGTLSNWSQIAGGFQHTVAVKTDGTLWSWGYNVNGSLGINTTTVSIPSPVQIGAFNYWSKISSSSYTNIAIKTDGTLWGWGQNLYGQLGIGNSGNARSSLIQIGSLSNWIKISTGGNHTAAIKTDGTLWIWGLNSNGQLGLSDQTNRSSPVQVGVLSNWSQISCGYSRTGSVKTDGTLWTWGNNSAGQLGLGDVTHRSSPVQVGTLSNWSQISCGFFQTAAIKTNGTLWTWGINSNGQLGQNDLTHRSSPTQVGTLSNWSQVACGYRNNVAIKTDGTLWSWGLNSNGQLGVIESTNRISPVQVGVLSNWTQIAVGQRHTLAINSNNVLWSWGQDQFGGLGLIDPGTLPTKLFTGL